MKPVVAILVLVGAIVAGALYSNDLIQKNSEHLFQTKEGQKSFLEFNSRFLSEKQLVVSIIKKQVDEELYVKVKREISRLRERWQMSGVSIVDFYSIYSKKIKSDSLQEIKVFIKNNPKLLFKFINEREITFLVIFSRELALPQAKAIFIDIKSIDSNVAIAGLLFTNQLLNDYSEDIKKVVFPLMLLLASIITLVVTRSLTTSVVVLLPSVLALFLVLSVIKLFFENMNMITAIAPLLVFTLSLTTSYHLLYATKEFDSFKMLFKNKWRPVSLMAVTTSIGLGSLIISEIESIRQFAVLTSVLIIVVSVGIFLWYGLMFDILKRAGSKLRVLNTLPFKILERPSRVIAYSSIIAVVVISALLIPKVKILTAATEYFPKESYTKKSIDYITNNILGNPNYEIVISRKDGEEFEYDDFKKIEKLESNIQKHFKSSKLLSINQFVKELNYIYAGSKMLPQASLAFFTMKGQLPEEQRQRHMKDGFYRVTVLGPNIGHEEFNLDTQFFKTLSEQNPGYDISLNGVQYSMLKAQEFLIVTLVKSFMLSLLIITTIFSLMFRRLFAIGPFVIANVVPLISSIIFIRAMDYSLNIATVMTFSISLGLIVDSTIHIIHDKAKCISVNSYVRTTLSPIFIGQLILVLSFVLFAMNDFLPIRETGGILAFTLFVALIFDIYHLPAMLRGRS